MMASENYTLSELMVAAAAREIRDRETVFVGMRLPLLGFLLAKSTHAPEAIGIYECGVIRDDPAPEPILTMGDLPNLHRAVCLAETRVVMGLLQQGRVDVSFIGGAQVDCFGNLNTTWVGSKGNARTRLPGSGGACDLASLAGRHVIVMKHEKRRFVPKVDYITSPGFGDGPGWREKHGLSPGGPCAIITTLGVFRFDPETCRIFCAALHPGVTPDMVKDNTGFDISFPAAPETTSPPNGRELAMIKHFDPQRFWTRD